MRDEEKQVLIKHNCLDSWVEINLSKDENQLSKYLQIQDKFFVSFSLINCTNSFHFPNKSHIYADKHLRISFET